MLNIGRLLLALRTSLAELDDFYASIEDREPLVGWPSIRIYGTMGFEYIQHLLPEYSSKAVFKGQTLPNREPIVIKFTNSYCVEAHRLLDAEGLAPRLRYFSGDDKTFKKPGGLIMIVMDFVENNIEATLKQEGRDDIKRAIDVLHKAADVFEIFDSQTSSKIRMVTLCSSILTGVGLKVKFPIQWG